MGLGFRVANRYWTLLMLLTGVLAGCGAPGSGALTAPKAEGGALAASAAGFGAELLPESFIDGGSAEGLTLELAAAPRKTVVTLRVAGAAGLKAAYLKLSYDASRYSPVAVAPGALLGGPGRSLSLDYRGEPGVVYLGQVLRQWDRQPGIDGAGVLAAVRFAPHPARIARQASTAPNTPRDKAQLIWDYATASLRWYYCNTGDYDQNGIVGLTDLTPLGQHFGKSAPGGFPEDSAVRQTDGDGNGAIQLGDLAMLGMNWSKSCAGGYNVYRSTNQYDCPTDPTTPPEASTFEGHLTLGEAQLSPNGRKQFTCTLPAVYDGHYYWVRPNDKLQDGSASAPLKYFPLGPGAWSMFGHDPQHTFRSSSTGPAAQPQMLWECALGTAVRSNPVATNNGIMYVTTEDSILNAVSPSGELLWSIPLDEKGNLSSTPAIGPDGTIYVGSRYYLCAVWPDSSWRWYMNAPECYTVSPALTADGLILIPGREVRNKLYCYNANGELQWEFLTTVDNGPASPAIAADGSIYAGFNGLRQFAQDEYLYKLNPAGEEQWHAVLPEQLSSMRNLGAPAIGATGSVHVVCKNLKTTASDPSPLLQTFPSGNDSVATVMLPGWPEGALSVSGAAIGANGEVYVRVGYSTGLESELYCVAPNLSLSWHKRLTHSEAQVQTVYTPTLDAAGTIYIVENTTLLAYLPDGTEAWSLDTGHVFCNSVSILSDGVIMAGFDDGYLRAFGE